MAATNYFTKREFQSPNYRWSGPKTERTKFFVYSTHLYWDEEVSLEQFNKFVVNQPGSVRKEDVDVFRMKHEFIEHYTKDDAAAVYMKNLKKDAFWDHLETMKKDSTLTYYDCFFFMFFTFMGKNSVKENNIMVEKECLHFFDGLIPIHEIWEKVRDIEQFRGKPKVFFIQADDYTLVYQPQKVKAEPVSFEPRKIPIDADRLIIRSSIPRKDTCKSETKGSFLVEAFIEVMEANRRRRGENQFDLLSLTTAVNHNVKRKIEELSTTMELAKNFPYPQVTSTFTKFLYL